MRKCSALVATDREGKFLLQHRTEDAPTWPGRWGLFGGGQEPGESPMETLVREVEEEIGVDASGARELCTVLLEEEGLVMSVFHMVVTETREDLLSRLGEGQGLGFYSLSEYESMSSVPCDIAVVRDVARMADVMSRD